MLDALTQGAPERILSLFVITLVPYSLVGPFAGVVVDRLPRRALLVGTNVFRAVLLGTVSLWAGLLPGEGALYAGALVLLGFGRLYLTTKSAVLPMVVPEDRLLRANASSNGFGMVSGLGGAAAGVLLAGLLGTTGAFALTGGIYLGSAGLATLISLPPRASRSEREPLGAALGRVAGDLLAGLRLVWNNLRARLPLTAIFLARTVALLIAIVAVLVIKTEFPEAGDRFGRLSAGALALGAAGAGAFIGTVTAGVLGRRLSEPVLMLAGLGISGTGGVVLGGIIDLFAVSALSFVAGYGAFVTKVAVDAHFRTNVPTVSAIGDLIAGPMLAHKAEDEGIAFAEILAGKPGHVDYDTIPSVIYTWPEVASVGLTEEQVKERGVEYRVGKFPFLANGRAKAMDETEGLVKIIADAKTDRVLGVHIIGAAASDLIAEAVAAMEFKAAAEDIGRICHPHPSLSEVVREAALAVDKRALNR